MSYTYFKLEKGIMYVLYSIENRSILKACTSCTQKLEFLQL